MGTNLTWKISSLTRKILHGKIKTGQLLTQLIDKFSL